MSCWLSYANAAALNGRPDKARRHYRIASVALGLLAVVLFALAVLAAGVFVRVLAKQEKRARRVFVLLKGAFVAGSAGLAVFGMAEKARRRSRALELDRVLAARTEDRAAVFLFDQLDKAVEAAPRLRSGEAFLYFASGLTITTERVLDAPTGSCPSEEAKATIAYLREGVAPADPVRERLVERASRELESGETVLAAAPGPKDEEGTVVTTRRLLAVGPERVTKAVSLGEAVKVRQVLGEERKHNTLVIRGRGVSIRGAAARCARRVEGGAPRAGGVGLRAVGVRARVISAATRSPRARSMHSPPPPSRPCSRRRPPPRSSSRARPGASPRSGRAAG